MRVIALSHDPRRSATPEPPSRRGRFVSLCDTGCLGACRRFLFPALKGRATARSSLRDFQTGFQTRPSFVGAIAMAVCRVAGRRVRRLCVRLQQCDGIALQLPDGLGCCPTSAMQARHRSLLLEPLQLKRARVRLKQAKPGRALLSGVKQRMVRRGGDVGVHAWGQVRGLC